MSSSLYGRRLAKLKARDARGGESYIVAAKGIHPSIAAEFTRYGV
jgi:hypothetical protein